MKRIVTISMVLICLFTLVTAQSSISKWQTQPLTIDGDGSDWGTMPRFFNSESNIKYEFRNDAQNLYIIIKAADRATQIQQVLAGFSVKLKIKGASIIKMGINFPPKKRAEMPGMNQESRTDKLVEKSITKPETQIKDTAILDGFLYTNGVITSGTITDKNICFARSIANKESGAYEIQIPLREIFGDHFNLENICATPIQLQVNINELSQKEVSKMRSGMHGERGMHGGGMRGGGQMGGGMPGGGEMGEMSGGEGSNEPQNDMRRQFTMDRKGFNKDFVLSNGK
jgi:hypothetical protein